MYKVFPLVVGLVMQNFLFAKKKREIDLNIGPP